MLSMIAAVVVSVIAAILILAAMKSDDLHVERSLVMKASPRQIFPLINELRAWEAWTPYDRDPGMRETYSGPAGGPGARYAWTGNREAGEGSITITQSLPYSQVALDLDMIKPFQGHNKVVFRLMPDIDGTRVTWELDDKTPYVGKVVGLFVDLDRKIGSDFEEGLARLKRVAERTGRTHTEASVPYRLECVE